ncbi:CpsD/CapB family tyrosine-protein kinase [Telmatospirillum sp. J64-1]|uniref:CpsD/CapB family tyrosine-protein kinase n=1 Tax=Telmatospirillum sp. J64-1 TaxID=2502183 RepID=UPI00115E3C0A|nr:CpsD/CapB family tyrosine-protein kinase [Telmatospirillum sp. J64-1]
MSRLYDALQNARTQAGGVGALPRGPIVAKRPMPSTAGNAANMDSMRLYQSIEAALAGRPSKVVQIMGCRGGEGASTVASRLAQFASLRMGRSVLLLNTSGRAPSNQLRLTGPGGSGGGQTGEVLPPAEVAVTEGGNGLFTGSLPIQGGPGDLHALNPALLHGYWNKLRERLDMVILDSPPALSSPYGLGMAATVDGVVLVIEAEQTRAPVAQAARDALVKAGANVLGVALNKRRFYVPQFLYDRL